MKINEFEKLINYKFINVELIELAFTHSSLKKRIKKNISYERLEFLGDRVLSLIISHELFIKFPNEDEGSLSKRLSDLISKNKLIEVANELNLQGLLKIDSSERKNMNKNMNNSILSDVCESVIGAITPFDILYGNSKSIKNGNLNMAHHSGFTENSLATELAEANFSNIAIMKREKPPYDIWAIATCFYSKEGQLKILADTYFP